MYTVTVFDFNFQKYYVSEKDTQADIANWKCNYMIT